MDAVAMLRQVLPQVDPSLLTTQDRLALLDLVERTFAGGASVALNRPAS